jgi:hypothetical protein
MLVIGDYLSGECDDGFSLERMRVRKLLPGFRRISILLATSAILVPVYYTHAQTSITGSQTTPVKTNGNDVTIESGGTITITGGAAITVNSNNTVDNEGTIAGNNGNNMNGILVTTGATGTITNDGSITLTDSTPATTIPLTGGTNRYGIQIAGPTPFIGGITNSATGSIAVRGNNSDGIYLNTGGLNGAISDQGTISITGNNSFGILVNAGAPILGGGNGIVIINTVTALGTGSGGVLINGAVGGALYIDETIRSTGYYDNEVTTTRPVTNTGLTANNELQGGSAVSVNATLGNGITVDTLGDIVTYGAAPALLIAPASGTVNIGGTGTDGADIHIIGSVHANGIYDGISASGIQIGGGTGLVTLTGSVDVTGKVQAVSYAAAATGITIGSGATVASIVNLGTVQSMVNFGFNGTSGGTSTAILDSGGALTSIVNRGAITATTANGTAIAMDLRHDTTFVTVRQSPLGTTIPVSITGDILFGSQGAALDLDAGTIAGSIRFGNSTRNALTINNGGVLGGAMTQAAGGQLALDINDGRLSLTNVTDLELKSLTLGAQGQFDFAVDPMTDQSGSATVVGAVMIKSGATIGLTFDAALTTPSTFTVIQTAASSPGLAGQPALLLGDVAYFYNAKVVTDAADGTVSVDVGDRPFSQAGVLGSASAYDAIFKANYSDPEIRDVFNAAGSQQAFRQVFQQMLPSYSGGVFEVLAQGADSLARTEAGNPVAQNGNRGGGWAQQFGFGAVDSTSSSPGYHGGGLGFAFGWEAPASTISTWGVSVAYMRAAADDFNTGPGDEQVATTYTAGVYWREIDGGLHTDASLNAGIAELNSNRFFSGTDLTGAAVMRSATAAWSGGVAQAHLGISYEQPIGGDFFVKPSVAGDYFVLYQGSSSEHNGGNAFDLNVASSTDKQGSVTGGLTVGMQFGDRDFTWRPEVMVGYKQIFGGPDTTVAQFAGGSSFSLTPASQDSGPVAHVGVHGGNKYSDFAVEAGGEDRGDYRAFDGRVVARFQF